MPSLGCPGIADPPVGRAGGDVPFPCLGCRPPGLSLLRYRQEAFSFIPVKFHLVDFRPVFPEIETLAPESLVVVFTVNFSTS